MNISVRFFARARDLVGSESVQLTCPEAATVGDLKRLLVERHPALDPIVGSLLIAVDRDFADENSVLSEGAEVACFPPVSGG
jgi:sulfur-carrier protein